MLTGVLALWLVAASLLALAPAVSAASSVFAGTWVSIDTDDSTQMLAIGRGSSPAVTYQDFYASSACAGEPSTHFVATGRGTIEDDVMWVDFRNGGCGNHKFGPFGMGLFYDGGSDTLTDTFGIIWHRFP
jgi:hypothetical protein